VGDFNGDNIPDLAVTSLSDGHVNVFLGAGDGTFLPRQAYDAGSTPENLAVGNFDGDGNLDLAVTTYNPSTLVILDGSGTGSFELLHTYPCDYARAVTVGKFDASGNLDIALANEYTNAVSVFLGSGDGSFQAPRSYSVGGLPYAVAVGDFYNHNVADLITANEAGGGLSLLRGNGDGTFQPAVNVPVPAGGNPTSLALGDFNGDGNLDVAVATPASYGLFVLLGNGDGTFQPPQFYGIGASRGSVVTADFNQDSVPDLAAVSSNGVAVLLGNGDGTFQAPRFFGAGDDPLFIATGDFNGDSFPDVVVVNVQMGISVLINSTDWSSPLPPRGQSPNLAKAGVAGASNNAESRVLPFVLTTTAAEEGGIKGLASAMSLSEICNGASTNALFQAGLLVVDGTQSSSDVILSGGDLPAIRQERVKLGLDWDQPAFSPAGDLAGAASLRLTLNLGNLGPKR
jgi:hypothetical protein